MCELAAAHHVHVEVTHRSSSNVVSRYATSNGTYLLFYDIDNNGSVDVVEEIAISHGTWHILDVLTPETGLNLVKSGKGCSF